MTITSIHHKIWDNSVKVIRETDRAVMLEVTGDRRFVPAGARAWFPKSGLTVDDGVARVKPWFWMKASYQQQIVIGTAE